MIIGQITCNYFMRIYQYRKPNNFNWGDMCDKYRKEFSRDDFMQLAEEIAQMGYENLEIWEPTFSHKVYTEAQGMELAKDLKAMGFNKIAYCIGGWGANNIHEMDKAFSFAKALGAKVVTGCIRRDNKESTLSAVEGCCLKYGMLYAIENHPAPNLESPGEIREVIDRYVNIGANLDSGIYHMQAYDVMEAARLLRDKIYHVHFKDTVTGGSQCLPIGDGTAPLAELARYLRDTGYEHMLSVEFEYEGDPAPGLRKSIAYIREVFE